MRPSVVFVMGLLLGTMIATGSAQDNRLAGENYVNHVAIAVENFDEAFTFYTQKMGFREAFTVRDAAGKPTLAYVQANRNTFVELQQANANRRPGLNHFGLHVENLKAVVAALKQRGVTVDEPRVRPDDSSVANATDPAGSESRCSSLARSLRRAKRWRAGNNKTDMKALVNAAGLIAVFAFVSGPLSAQWPPYPTAGVPRTSTGQPNLAAPAPRTPDGKPDLSGVWQNFGQAPLGFGSGGAAGSPLPDGTLPTGVNQFRDIGSGFPDGLPFQPWAAALKKQRMADNSKDNPDAHCLPMGNMQLHTHPQPRRIIQNPQVIVILYEGNAGVREMFTDGRPLPANDAQPWWYGYSTGKWDGDTLVVQTSGFRDGGWLDIIGSPLTDAAKWTERFRRVNYGNPGNRDHGRRSEGVHEAVDRHGEAAHHARHGVDRVHLRGERKVESALSIVPTDRLQHQ